MARFAEFVSRHLMWSLLAIYVLAWQAPEWGEWAASLDLATGVPTRSSARLPMVLVALLLFIAAMSVDLKDLRAVLHRPGLLAASLAAVWGGPAMVVLLASWLTSFDSTNAFGGMLLGMTLVAAMPVANSSAGWTLQARGAMAWSLGLVVFSIVLSPFVTPILLTLLGMSLSTFEAVGLEHQVLRFSGVIFIVWVLLPTGLGFAARRWQGGERIDRLRPVLLLITALAILMLNYVNGSLALPKVLASKTGAPLLAAAACGAAAFSSVGVALAELLGRLFVLPRATRQSLRFSLSMKHTGLALGLASTVLADHPEALLFIILATPLQHFTAGLINRFGTTRSG